ncbi:DUF2188 domain-containing protein [Actinopolymorpha pittospori]|uniref:Uncharacterized protein n=1 Tax=Actinopolymorpha pittospori TaxID=648752 RepID=A0A927MRR1_9ACTN|nr:hypothetical protein [Actinopolymorpha pittospori]
MDHARDRYDAKLYRVTAECGRWKLSQGDEEILWFDTKDAAVEEGRKRAGADRPCQLVIRDGTIEVENIF